jgi:hypothetical protein
MMIDLKKSRDSNPIDPSLYRQLIGSLMYLEITQPNVRLVERLSYDIQLHGFIECRGQNKCYLNMFHFELCHDVMG